MCSVFLVQNAAAGWHKLKLLDCLQRQSYMQQITVVQPGGDEGMVTVARSLASQNGCRLHISICWRKTFWTIPDTCGSNRWVSSNSAPKLQTWAFKGGATGISTITLPKDGSWPISSTPVGSGFSFSVLNLIHPIPSAKHQLKVSAAASGSSTARRQHTEYQISWPPHPMVFLLLC